MAPMPPARPSMTSTRLIVLIIATSQNSVSGMPIHQGNGTTCRNGRAMLSIHRPKLTGTAAMANWPDELRQWAEPRGSSA